MCQAKQCLGGRIDNIAESILLVLDEADESLPVSTIKHRIGEQRQSVRYRLIVRDPSLVDLGIVAREEGDPPDYHLSVEGKFVVENNREEYERPTTFDEVSEMVREAREASESARNSVQNYRKDLWEHGQEIEHLEEKLDEIRKKGTGDVTRKDIADVIDIRSTQIQQDIDARASRIEARIDALEEELRAWEDYAEDLGDYVEYAAEDVDATAEELEDAREAHQTMVTRVDEIESEVDQLREEVDSGGDGWLQLGR